MAEDRRGPRLSRREAALLGALAPVAAGLTTGAEAGTLGEIVEALLDEVLGGAPLRLARPSGSSGWLGGEAALGELARTCLSGPEGREAVLERVRLEAMEDRLVCVGGWWVTETEGKLLTLASLLPHSKYREP